MFEPARTQHASQATAEQYRLKAENYRASADAESDPNRREAFGLLADTFDRLAAAYERIKSSRD